MERNSKVLEKKYDPMIGEEDELALASLSLMKINRTILKDEEINKLKEMTKEFLRESEYEKVSLCGTYHEEKVLKKRHNSDEEVIGNQLGLDDHIYQVPDFGYSIDRTILPCFPPIEGLHHIIGICSEPFEKQLTPSDVKINQNRLAFNKEDAKRAFEPLLRQCHKDVANGVKVKVYDSKGKIHDMEYKTWANSKAHVLIGGWKFFCAEHGLKANEDWVSVWMFTHKFTGELCIALTWKRIPTKVLLTRKRARNM